MNNNDVMQQKWREGTRDRTRERNFSSQNKLSLSCFFVTRFVFACVSLMTPTTTTTTTTTSLPTFGSEFGSSHWSFESNWINLNHGQFVSTTCLCSKANMYPNAGSYGAAPTIVMEAIQRIQQQSARAPDRFIKLEYEIALIKLRSRLAEFLHCDTDDLVLVTNASAGVNTVMRSLTTVWEKGDKIMYYSTTMCVLAFLRSLHALTMTVLTTT